MTMTGFEEDWQELNQELRSIESQSGDLRASLSALQNHQVASGFIRAGLDSVERFSFHHSECNSRLLRIQYNPGRVTRFQGAGLLTPPDQSVNRNEGCFLCRDNIRWQHQGRQFGYEIDLNGSPYITWMNPFPLLPGHVVVASSDHVSQEWDLHPNGAFKAKQIVRDLVSLASRTPGYAGFYNGVGAGASIPGHLHFQFFRPPPGFEPFPLEAAAIEARNEHPGQSSWRLERYPLEAMHWHGAPSEVADAGVTWLGEWAAHQNRLSELSANILTTSDQEGGDVSLFFVPRDRKRCQSSYMSVIIGGMEVLGELVLSTVQERQLLDTGKLDYFNLEQVLGEVCTPLNMP